MNLAPSISCPCGRRLFLPAGAEGKNFRCPKCRSSYAVPAAPPEEEVRVVGEKAPLPRLRRKRTAPSRKTSSPLSFEGKILSSGVLGGLAAMIGAIIWFGVGWLAGIIFIYPPILFVIGLAAMIRGLAR